MKYLLMILLSVANVAHGEVITKSKMSEMANYMYNGCMAQRNNITLQEVTKMNNGHGVDIIKEGYKFGMDYPSVGCNQIFITIIDEIEKKI